MNAYLGNVDCDQYAYRRAVGSFHYAVDSGLLVLSEALLPPSPCVQLDCNVALPPSRGLLTLAPTSHVHALASPCALDWSEGERKEV